MKMRALAVVLLGGVLLLNGCGGERQRVGQDEADTPDTNLAANPTAEWRTYHGDTDLRGHAEQSFPTPLTLRWRFLSGAEVRNTPVAAGDRIYFANAEGVVFAIDLDGNEVWRKALTLPATDRAPAKPEVLDAPLILHGSRLVVSGADGMLYALDAPTGEIIWQVDAESTLLGSPTFHEDHLYLITQSEGVLQARDMKDGALIWKADPVARCDGSLSAGDSFVAFGSCDAALHVRALKDGTALFDIPIDDDSQVAGGVAIDGHSLFSGSRSGKVLHANAKSGKVVWTNEDCEDEVFTTPAISDDWVVAASRDGGVLGLDRATGKKQWRHDAEGEPQSPVIAGDQVAVTAEGSLFLLGLAKGEERWSYAVSDTVTGPAVIGDMLVVGCDDGSVAAFGASQ